MSLPLSELVALRVPRTSLRKSYVTSFLRPYARFSIFSSCARFLAASFRACARQARPCVLGLFRFPLQNFAEKKKIAKFSDLKVPAIVWDPLQFQQNSVKLWRPKNNRFWRIFNFLRKCTQCGPFKSILRCMNCPTVEMHAMAMTLDAHRG